MRKLLLYFVLLKPVKLHFIGAFLCGLIYGVTSGFGLPFAISQIFPHIFGEETPPNLLLVGAIAFLPAIFLIRGISNFSNTYLINYCGFKVLQEIRLHVFSKLQVLPLQFFQESNRGDLLSRAMNDTRELQDSITKIANSLMVQPITFIGAMAALAYISIKKEELVFILFSFMVIPLCILPIRYIGRKLFAKAKKMQAELGAVTEYVSENLGAIREIRAFNLEEQQITRFREIIHGFFNTQLKVVKYTKVLSPTVEFVASLGVALAIYYASKARIGLEDVVALIAALYMSYEPVKKLGAIHNLAKKGMVSLNRIERILDEPEAISDKPTACELGRAAGRLEFCHVNFGYGAGPVLRNINCLIEAGQIYAFVGPSGAGKSTFINLIFRFYDIESGQILLDGHDLRDIHLHSLRNQLVLVPQDPVLFNDTIFNNIRLGQPDASEEAVYEAAQKAYAHHFIVGFEDGYDTIVGEKGTRLSGGQRQRIALARAFLKNAPILILDEATSALDSASENQIQEAMAELVHGKTVLIIAHRFTSIRLAHKILVFKAGQITAQGTHDELYQNDETYKLAYSQQLQ